MKQPKLPLSQSPYSHCLFQAIRAMIIVWLLAILLALPHAVFNKIESIFTYRHLIRCRTTYPENMRRWITLIAVTTQYVLPLTITGVLYWRIMVRIWSRDVLGVVTEGQLIVQARAKRKVKSCLCKSWRKNNGRENWNKQPGSVN